MKQWKKTIRGICLAVAIVASLSGLNPAARGTSNVQAASIKLSPAKKTLAVREKVTLKVAGTKKKASWSSSNPSVAVVSAGKVTAKKEGQAIITAQIGKKSLKCRITVKGDYRNLYKAFLQKGTASYKNAAYRGTIKTDSFCLVDIDKNGIPELILKGNDSHIYMDYHCVYTVKNGKIDLVGACSLHRATNPDKLYYSGKYKSIRYMDAMNGGWTAEYLLRMSGGKLKEYKYISKGEKVFLSGKYSYYYSSDGKESKKVEVSKAKYNTYKKKYFKGLKTYKFFKNTEANRTAKLGK